MNGIWLIFVTVAFIGLQGLLYRKYGMRNLEYERYYNVTRCFVGDQVEMVERIANRKWLPVPWVKLESTLSAHLKFTRQQSHMVREGKLYQNHRSMFSLMPYTKVIRRHKFVCERRGVYALGSATLSVGDLFGVYSMYSTIATDHRLIVYPKAMLPDGFVRPYNSKLGDVLVKRWIIPDPFMFAGIREYQYGDPMRDVNWKATARSGRIQVNQHDYTAERRVMVYLNVEDHEMMWNHVSNVDLIERGISYAAGIIEEAIHAGMEAGFASNGYAGDNDSEPIFIEAAGGRGQYERILEQMAHMQIARAVTFEQLLAQEVASGRSNLDIVIITSYMNDRLDTRKRQLEYNGNTVTVLLLEALDSMPSEGKRHDAPAAAESSKLAMKEAASAMKEGASAMSYGASAIKEGVG